MLRDEPSNSPLDPVAGRALRAPNFELPGTNGGDGALYRLSDFTDHGVTLVGFVAAESLASVAYLAWLDLVDGVDVVLVSDRKCTALDPRRSGVSLGVPLLGDPSGVVAARYGAPFDGTPGTLVLVDAEERVQRVWSTEADPMEVYAGAVGFLDDDPRVIDGGAG
jgi:peroxiredoxin